MTTERPIPEGGIHPEREKQPENLKNIFLKRKRSLETDRAKLNTKLESLREKATNPDLEETKYCIEEIVSEIKLINKFDSYLTEKEKNKKLTIPGTYLDLAIVNLAQEETLHNRTRPKLPFHHLYPALRETSVINFVLFLKSILE